MTWLAPLVEAVTQHWGRTGKAYNLARAKPELLKKGVALDEHLAGRKLKDAIQEDGSAELRLLRHPQLRLTWGLIPQSVELPADLVQVFTPLAEIKDSEAVNIRFSRGVWLAFSKPLKLGVRRYLEIKQPSPFLHEIADGEALPPSGLEVLPEYIWNPDLDLIPAENRDSQVVANIRRWAQEKGIPINDLSRADEGSFPNRERSSPMHLDVSALSQSDKARILIPLDLLEKIRFGR